MVASPTATYPAALDNPIAPSQFDSLATDGVEHDYLHDWAQDAIKKIEAKLGITSSPDVTSVDYVLKNHQHQGTDRSAQFARLPIKMVASQSLAPVEVQNNLGTTLSAITAAGEFLDIGATATTLAIRSYVAGDSNDRFQIQADGKIMWGPGNTTLGTAMYRTGTGQLRIDNQLGIGMNPTMALDVTGSARFSGSVTLSGGLAAPLPIASGGTGSITQNFVDLTAAQTIAGVKTFSSSPVFSTPLAIASGGTGSATQNFVDLTTAQTVAGIKTFSSRLVVSAGGLDVSGSPSGGYLDELRFPNGANAASATGAAISTLYTGSPRMYFDHRGSGNTGDWFWRNGTGAANSRMSLGSGGLLSVGDVNGFSAGASSALRVRLGTSGTGPAGWIEVPATNTGSSQYQLGLRNYANVAFQWEIGQIASDGHLSIATDGGSGPSEKVTLDSTGLMTLPSMTVGTTSDLARTATAGFLSIPRMNGSPTGVPTTQGGNIPIVFDYADSRLYFYVNPNWHYVQMTA